MKLLQINAALNTGSTGRITEQIALNARKYGWETFIMHGSRYVNKSNMHSIQTVTLWGEKKHALKSMLYDAHGLGSSSETRKIISEIERIQPDIIHLHNIHGYYINYKILFEYLQTIETPLVWTLHDCWTMTGHCTHFDAVGCDKWMTCCFDCPQLSAYPKSLFLDRSRFNYSLKKQLFTSVENMTIVPVSDWLSNIVRRSYLGKYPIHTIKNGVDISLFKPVPYQHLSRKLHCEGKKILLGVATSWNNKKGLWDYYELANRLSSEIKIILVGLDEKQLEELPNNIIGVKRTESIHELIEYYSMADIVLNLSYEETFGLTTIEGFACGTPCLVYNKTASPELVTRDTGCIVEAGNIDCLQKTINEMLLKGKETYTAKCRQHAIAHYNIEDRYSEYINLYQSLLSK